MIIDFSNPDIYVDRVGEVTEALYNPNIRYIFMKWWAWSWKSHTIVQLLLQNIIDNIRVGWFRKVNKSIRRSCYQLGKDYIDKWNLWEFIETQESMVFKSKINWWFLSFFWLDDVEKIKSLADYDWFWVEEWTEISFDDFTQLDLRLRWRKNHKIIFTFNPVSNQHWLKTQVLDSWLFDHNSVRINKTARQNKFIDKNYLSTLDSLKEKNPNKWKIYAKNEWGEWNLWQIFNNLYTFDHDIDPDIIWLDFWFNDPTALTYIKKLDQWEKLDIYIQEKLYKRELTWDQLIRELEVLQVPKNILIVADSARPELIEQINRAWYKIVPADKWKWSVLAWITLMQQVNLHINWWNAEKEFNNYCWKVDRNGKSLDMPIDWNDHNIDSSRYWIMYLLKPQSNYFFDII